ncbi:Uncharacterised protein [marine metagenome]
MTVGRHCFAKMSAKPAMWGVSMTLGADHIGSACVKGSCSKTSSPAPAIVPV